MKDEFTEVDLKDHLFDSMSNTTHNKPNKPGVSGSDEKPVQIRKLNKEKNRSVLSLVITFLAFVAIVALVSFFIWAISHSYNRYEYEMRVIRQRISSTEITLETCKNPGMVNNEFVDCEKAQKIKDELEILSKQKHSNTHLTHMLKHTWLFSWVCELNEVGCKSIFAGLFEVTSS